MIEVFRLGLQEALFRETSPSAPSLGMARSVRAEVRFFRDAAGARVEIDLETPIERGTLLVVDAPAADLRAVIGAGPRRLGPGEIESLALVAGGSGRFCTADVVAMRYLARSGLASAWVSLEEVLEARGVPTGGLSRRHRQSFWTEKVVESGGRGREGS